MTSDDPFGRSDRTIIRPNPAGRLTPPGSPNNVPAPGGARPAATPTPPVSYPPPPYPAPPPPAQRPAQPAQQFPLAPPVELGAQRCRRAGADLIGGDRIRQAGRQVADSLLRIFRPALGLRELIAQGFDRF
ncbi:MAG: hypothetical protein JO049_10645 [Hyphomicrobiales bacterium]|nr:hypothetical protein [Hyphomicrobiales bacterium]